MKHTLLRETECCNKVMYDMQIDCRFRKTNKQAPVLYNIFTIFSYRVIALRNNNEVDSNNIRREG